MLSADESPGVFYFLVGIVIVVMAGVGLSLVVDRRFRFSSLVGQLEEEIAGATNELSELEGHHDARSRRLARAAEISVANAARLGRLSKSQQSAGLRQAVLKEHRDRLKASIVELEEDFSRYRSHYRNGTWSAAVGEKLGSLRIRSGRDYAQAEIIKVSEVGLEIRHANGMARIPASDLDPFMQDRFQWSDEGRRNLLRAELVHESALGGGVPGEILVRKVDAESDHEELKLLRHQVARWQANVAQLLTEQNEAASQVGHRNQKSVPGSLETWQARAARLSSELRSARGQLALAKSRLAAVAPSDLLLKESGHE